MQNSIKPVVIIALGGNLSAGTYDSGSILAQAAARLQDEGLTITAASSLWRSLAWPDPSEPAYINAVVLVETSEDAPSVLALLHRVEAAFGRERQRPNQARTLDLDLIAYGDLVLDDLGLILPHPRAHERLFVMGPLCEIAPDWVHPVLKQRADALAASATIGVDAHPVSDFAIHQIRREVRI